MRIALAQITTTADRAANLERALLAIDAAAERPRPSWWSSPRSCSTSSSRPSKCVGACPGPAGALAETGAGADHRKAGRQRAREHGIVIVFNLYEIDGRRPHLRQLAGDRRRRQRCSG